MGIIKNFKNFFFRRALKSGAAQMSNIERHMLNLKHARKIGVLFDASNSEHAIIVTQFANLLQNQGKEVFLLGYQNSTSKEGLGEHFFDKNNTTWYNKPTGKKISDYQKLNLDILVCAFLGECLPLEYIAATSRAKFRVGAFGQCSEDCFELMINVKEKLDLKYLLQQITHFLKVINKDEA